jgi:inorganic pyrophosphatase
MNTTRRPRNWEKLGQLFRPHPWHGIPIGPDAPRVVTAYVEIVPTDTVKYEIDKTTGYLKVDRPQKFSNVCPTPYGMIPQTCCGERVGALASERTGRPGIVGDGDPMDICVLTEKVISHSDLLMDAIPIGGLRLLDGNEADDKILAVLKGDAAYGQWQDISDCPRSLIQRLMHYFLTYKQEPGVTHPTCEITHVYGRDEAHEVIQRSRADYEAAFGNMRVLLGEPATR